MKLRKGKANCDSIQVGDARSEAKQSKLNSSLVLSSSSSQGATA